MRRVIALLLLTAAIITSCVIGLAVTKQQTRYFTQLAHDAVTMLADGDTDEAHRMIQRIRSEWISDGVKKLSFCIGAERLDGITMQIDYTAEMAKQQDGSFLRETVLLELMIDDLYDDERLSLRRMF